MELRDVESTLPPGFRFHPSDEELVCHYLYNKVTNQRSTEGTMVEVDLHTREPWELPDAAKLTANEWYLFSFRDRKYATGSRTNRATKSGYWKATGKDRVISYPRTDAMVGMRKTLVFYRGRAPSGIKTVWVMHEFRLETPRRRSPPKEEWVLCRVFRKRKGESSDQHENTAATASSSSTVLMRSPPSVVEIPMQIEEEENVSSNPFMNMALLNCNFFSHHVMGNMENTMASKSCEVTELGFLDLKFEHGSAGGDARFSQHRQTAKYISACFYDLWPWETCGMHVLVRILASMYGDLMIVTVNQSVNLMSISTVGASAWSLIPRPNTSRRN